MVLARAPVARPDVGRLLPRPHTRKLGRENVKMSVICLGLHVVSSYHELFTLFPAPSTFFC